jgi:hypothetical protein
MSGQARRADVVIFNPVFGYGPISLKKAAVVECIGASADRAERLY